MTQQPKSNSKATSSLIVSTLVTTVVYAFLLDLSAARGAFGSSLREDGLFMCWTNVLWGGCDGCLTFAAGWGGRGQDVELKCWLEKGNECLTV